MPHYVVSLSASSSCDVEIEASTPEEAVSLAKARRVSLEGVTKVESVSRFERGPLDADDEPGSKEAQTWEVVGFCESCSKLLLQDLETGASETYKLGGGEDDTLYFCLACFGEITEDEGSEPEKNPPGPSRFDASDLPEIIREALANQEPDFKAEMIERWRLGDDATKADLIAFFAGDDVARAVLLEPHAGPVEAVTPGVAVKTRPEELAREVYFVRPGDVKREVIALAALRRVLEWVESGSDFDLVLDRQNLARPSTAPVRVERDPAFDAAKLAEHWEPLDVPDDMVARDVAGRVWNHLDPVPSRESEGSSNG